MKKDKQDIFWIGADVSKHTFDAALARGGQHFPSTPLRDLPWRTFARTEDGAREFLDWLDGLTGKDGRLNVRVIMESTGDYSVELARWLAKRRSTLAPAIENPARTKAFIDSLGQRNKTDGLDARGLAFYGVERRPSPYEPLTPGREELRSLTRCRDALVKDRTALKNRLHGRCASRVVKTMRARQLRTYTRDILRIDTAIHKVIDNTPNLKADFNLLVSMAGVGFVTASVVLAELGDLRRFNQARQLTAFVGVSPRIFESGSSVRGKTHLCKRGNGRVRQALYLSAMAVIRTSGAGALKDTYQRLCSEGKPGKAALGAVMRKQLVIMRAILISGKPYDPLWKTSRKTNTRTAN